MRDRPAWRGCNCDTTHEIWCMCCGQAGCTFHRCRRWLRPYHGQGTVGHDHRPRLHERIEREQCVRVIVPHAVPALCRLKAGGLNLRGLYTPTTLRKVGQYRSERYRSAVALGVLFRSPCYHGVQGPPVWVSQATKIQIPPQVLG